LARHVGKSVTAVVPVAITLLILVCLARFKALLQGGTLRMQIINRLILSLQSGLQLANQPFLKVIKLVELMLMHHLLLQMFMLDRLICPLNRF